MYVYIYICTLYTNSHPTNMTYFAEKLGLRTGSIHVLRPWDDDDDDEEEDDDDGYHQWQSV